MGWQQAFLSQAISDFQVLRGFRNRADLEDCHRLHYLQMATEKPAKSYLVIGPSADPQMFTHAAFVRFLQTLKAMPHIRKTPRFSTHEQFAAYVNAMIPLAASIQALAPAIAGTNMPNPEYPWYDRQTNTVLAPCDYHFDDLSPASPRMLRLITLVQDLLYIERDFRGD